MGYARARYEEAQETVPRQRRQFGRMVEIGYQRRAQEENDVERRAHQRAEPEDGVVVAVSGILLVGQGGGEPALLQRGGDEAEDGEHPHHAVIRRRQQPRQEDAEKEVQQLLHAVADASPKQAAGGLFL